MSDYRGHVVLIVNVASLCSFTPQYAGLEELFQKYRQQGLTILGFPCDQFLHQEPGNNEQISRFCQSKYGVTFPMFAKIMVNGPDAHPLFQFLKNARAGWLGVRRIGWNFSKFLLDRQGNVVRRFPTMASPASIEPYIASLLQHHATESSNLHRSNPS
jgi:glutathione peroxidase